MVIRAIVVGGTNGIGFGLACRVAAEVKSSTVIISGRTKPKHIPHANMEFRALDATSMRQIKQYTDTFKSAPDQKLDFLIMTQGIMNTAGRTETPEGIDRKMALHYYGKQLLIRELMPALKEDAKVIIVFDSVYGNATKLDWDDLDLKKHFSLAKSANHCMVMNDAMIQFYAAEQQRQGTGRRHFIHAWPGTLVGTSPDTYAERLLGGVAEHTAAGASEGPFWYNLNHKGRLVAKKTIFTEEQMKTVADHTWKLVDGAVKGNLE